MPGTSRRQATLTEPRRFVYNSNLQSSTTPPTTQTPRTSMVLAIPQIRKKLFMMESMEKRPAKRLKTETPAPPSLKTLALNEAFKQIMDPEFTDSKFASLPPHLRKLLFGKLQEGARKWNQVVKKCPPVDLELYLTKDLNIPIMGWEVIKASEREYEGLGRLGEEDVHEHISGYFQNIWLYISEGEEHFPPCQDHSSGRIKDELGHWVPVIGWGTESLYLEPQEGILKLCTHGDACCRCNGKGIIRISSYLLLSRLVATFGMPPYTWMPEEYACWYIGLKFDGDVSEGRMRDVGGSGFFEFIGSPTASEEFFEID